MSPPLRNCFFLVQSPGFMAQVPYAVHEEMVLTLNDLLWRRTKWAHYRDLPNEVIEKISVNAWAAALSWTEEERG